jgi:hypothetical protein
MPVSTNHFHTVARLLHHANSIHIKPCRNKIFPATAWMHHCQAVHGTSNNSLLKHSSASGKANDEPEVTSDERSASCESKLNNVTLHKPVLVNEVVDTINPQDGQVHSQYFALC